MMVSQNSDKGSETSSLKPGDGINGMKIFMHVLSEIAYMLISLTIIGLMPSIWALLKQHPVKLFLGLTLYVFLRFCFARILAFVLIVFAGLLFQTDRWLLHRRDRRISKPNIGVTQLLPG
jgi:hypothetical protein